MYINTLNSDSKECDDDKITLTKEKNHLGSKLCKQAALVLFSNKRITLKTKPTALKILNLSPSDNKMERYVSS